MSEYQYYEFQAVDRPLSEEGLAAMRRLSSRVELTPTSAAFTYNYGDFRGNPEAVLAQYFDVMLYMANWGSRQLMFRFPAGQIDLAQVKTYCIEELITIQISGEYVLLNIAFYDEEADGWLEGEGWLPKMVGLRQDLLQQDYRLLYLAWLKAAPLDGVADYVAEPPLPAGLGQLSPGLRAFIELFEIDEYLVEAAAEASPLRVEVSEAELRQAIRQLSREECDTFLLRLARGEAQVAAALNRRLAELIDHPPVEPASPKRTLGQLLEAAKRVQAEAKVRRKREAEARHRAELQALAQRGDQVWEEVQALIQQSNWQAYDQVTQLLVKLREVAISQGRELVFQQRLNRIFEQYPRRSTLLKRLRQAGLYQL